jgi:iron complex outermembrane receptor protein
MTVHGAVSYRRADGYRPNTDFWNLNSYARVQYESARAGDFDIQGGFQRREWGSNGFYSLRYPDQFESTLTGLTSLRWTKRWGDFKLEATGAFRQNNDLFAMERDDPSNIPFNYHTSYNVSGSLKADYDWERAGTTSFGGNFTRHTMFSTAMGEVLDSPSHKIPGLKGELYPKRAARDIASAWLGHSKEWRRTWAGGQAILNNTPYGSEGTFAAEAGVLAGRVFRFKGDVLRTMRLPTFTDLFYNVATYHPDPNLRPETAMTYRLTAAAVSPLGMVPRTGWWSVEASLYYRDTKNVIDWEQRTGDREGDVAGDWYSTQLNRLGTFGAEFSARYSDLGTSWLRTAMLNYGYTHTDKNVTTGYISKYALDYMRHKLSAVIWVALAHEFTLTLTGSLYDRTGSYIAADGTQQGYDPYFLLDGRLSWEPKSRRRTGLQLYLDATNITGTNWFDYGGLPMPRTWLSGGVVITIG